MQIYQYNKKSLVFDMLRATLGLVIILPAFFLSGSNIYLNYSLGGLTLMFFYFAIMACIRCQTQFSIADQELIVKNKLLGTQSTMILADIKKLVLHYYSTRRDRRNGWMQLKISDSKKKIRINSEVDDFDTLLQCIVSAIPSHKIELDDITSENLHAVGIEFEHLEQEI